MIFCDRWLVRLCALALTLFLLCPAFSAKAAGRTVKVGYFPVSSYQETAQDGTRSGFSYDYFMQIQKYTRWEYEFVEKSYAECLRMLISGEIDLMSGIGKTAEREEQLLFSRYSVSNSQQKIFAMENAQDIFYESFDTFDGCKIAMLRGTLTDELDNYCAMHHFSLDVVFYDSPAQMISALENGEVSLVCAASVGAEVPTKIVAHLDKMPLYFAVAKNEPELLTELDDALSKISQNNPNFYTQMSEKYMVSGANATATFTREETAYLASGEKVYMILNPDWAPISWYDAEAKGYCGIIVDVVDRIKAYTGLDIVFCTEDEFNQEIVPADPNAVENVVAVLCDDTAWAVQQNVLMSNHVMDSSVVMVTKRTNGQTRDMETIRLALPDQFYISMKMAGEFNPSQIAYYDTVEQCLNAINAGAADATFVSEAVATYYLSRLEYSEFFAAAASGYSENLAFAVNKDSTRPLLSILDKSLLCIGTADLNQIVISNSIARQRASLAGLYYSNPVLVTLLLLLFLGLVCAGVLIAFSMRSRRLRMTKELEREAETNAARTEFFMMISHELRTPMNAIVGYLNLAYEQCRRDGAEREYIKRSQNAAKQLAHIAEDMLDYTRIASDTVTLREEVFDLKDTVSTLEQNVSLDAEKKNITLRFLLHNLLHEFVVGDHLRVAQIMQNILSNAVKFTGEGGSITVDIREEKQEDGTLLITFSVTDTGRGMSEEYLKKICAPFEQNDHAYSRTHGGLGLGLYLTRYYLQAMNGTLDVTSKQGEGSCFTVHLPLKMATGDQVMQHGADLSHVRVLIAGEDADENTQLKDTLKRIGIKSDAVTEWDKILKRIESRAGGDYAYALCIIDDRMAYENTELLSAIAQLPNAPGIFVTTGSAKAMEQLEKLPQIQHVLYRPIFQSVLFNALLEKYGAYKVTEKSLPQADFHGIIAMIVEDNRINSDILKRMLSRANVACVVCENGREAVDTFLQQPPETFSMILMDIQMPVMNGYDATVAIRNSAHPQAKRIPIIAVSANAFQEDVDKSLACGMNEHLSKPVNVGILYQTIQKYLSLDRNRKEE